LAKGILRLSGYVFPLREAFANTVYLSLICAAAHRMTDGGGKQLFFHNYQVLMMLA